MVWSMDDNYYGEQHKNAEQLSMTVPYLDSVIGRHTDEFISEVRKYFRKVYPYSDPYKFGMKLTDAADEIMRIALQYLPQNAAVGFVRTVLGTVIHDSRPGSEILDAILDKGRTYVCRSFYSEADKTKTEELCGCLKRYFHECRIDDKLKSKVCARLLLQKAIRWYTRKSSVAYHILTMNNAAEILSEERVTAVPESELYVKRRIYTMLCAMDDMPPYLTGEFCLRDEKET